MAQLDLIKDYYGKVLASKNDLKTTACCSAESLAPHLSRLVVQIHDEVRSKFYGCGVPIPACLEGLTVLDLGCGTGRDCYLLSSLVGPQGKVIGVDMTDEQLQTARQYQDYHRDIFKQKESNISFRQGFIEDLASLDIADNSVDLVVSNCVINLSPDKDRVFAEIFRVLKPGGELYFSDVYADRRLPAAFSQDPVLLGECLGGALYFEDFRRILAKQNCLDARMISRTEIMITDPTLRERLGNARFFSITTRAFKLPLEDRCEDYGQVAWYKGTIEHAPHGFALDDHHIFEKGKPMLVCSNTASMLQDTRYQKHFRVDGDTSMHFGLFDCGPTTAAADASSGGACC
ncbi:MAG TPA: methyltransferase domain-containing protein [Oligoflexus sp.]|uniref:methyltransferase domain-containing protein n=1 Tax=Oligoflexus sp. TaxID=1971216 RepID=UPI002D604E4E|nr:methyltransferase domain-containing protein [Oligoflexus sp.]HYX38951.1 methyltransferase domain-containing protein [Oligoflexus sp.]